MDLDEDFTLSNKSYESDLDSFTSDTPPIEKIEEEDAESFKWYDSMKPSSVFKTKRQSSWLSKKMGANSLAQTNDELSSHESSSKDKEKKQSIGFEIDPKIILEYMPLNMFEKNKNDFFYYWQVITKNPNAGFKMPI